MSENRNPPLLGYTDRLSARPNDVVQVQVSSYLEGDFEAGLVRIICADPNPEGTGLIEEGVACDFAGRYPSRIQPFPPGSCMHVSLPPETALPVEFTVVAMIWPTRPDSGPQVVLSMESNSSHAPFILGLDATGRPTVRVRMSDGNWTECCLPNPVNERRWTRLWASFSQSLGELSVGVSQDGIDDIASTAFTGSTNLSNQIISSIVVAACDQGKRRMHFNGKIERPTIYSAQLGPDMLIDSAEVTTAPVFACWDFSKEISSKHVIDTGVNELHGTLVNYPARAMTGANWDGSEMCWRHAQQQYGAIRFHEDDIYDFEWETDFSFTVPKDLRSGIYGIRLKHGKYHDMIPLFVCPPLGQRTSRLCLLVSTFTYTIYGNHARPDYEASWQDKITAWGAYPWNPAQYPHYGCSTYNFHSDRSGICHASHRRP